MRSKKDKDTRQSYSMRVENVCISVAFKGSEEKEQFATKSLANEETIGENNNNR